MARSNKWAFGTGLVNPLIKASRKASEYITSLEGFYGVYPSPPRGMLWFFKSLNEAKRAKNLCEAKGIKCGKYIAEFSEADDGSMDFVKVCE